MLKISETWLRCRNVYLWDKIWVGIRIWKYKCAEVCSGFETGHEIPKFEQSTIYTYWTPFGTRKESSIPYKNEKVRDFTSDPLLSKHEKNVTQNSMFCKHCLKEILYTHLHETFLWQICYCSCNKIMISICWKTMLDLF